MNWEERGGVVSKGGIADIMLYSYLGNYTKLCGPKRLRTVISDVVDCRHLHSSHTPQPALEGALCCWGSMRKLGGNVLTAIEVQGASSRIPVQPLYISTNCRTLVHRTCQACRDIRPHTLRYVLGGNAATRSFFHFCPCYAAVHSALAQSWVLVNISGGKLLRICEGIVKLH